jgi:hypothetical protein
MAELYEEPLDKREYDGETGEETLESAERIVSRADEELIREAHELEQMTQTFGWKRFDAFVEECIAAFTDKLILEKDQDEIKRLQETVKAYASVKDFVLSTISRGKSREEALKQDPTPSDNL